MAASGGLDFGTVECEAHPSVIWVSRQIDISNTRIVLHDIVMVVIADCRLSLSVVVCFCVSVDRLHSVRTVWDGIPTDVSHEFMSLVTLTLTLPQNWSLVT